MSNDNPRTKEIRLGCYQGIRSERPAIWKDYFAVQTINIPVVGKGTKRVEYTCKFCAEKVELTIPSTLTQSLSCLGTILVLAGAVGLIYWGDQKQIWGNTNTVFLYCLAIVGGLGLAALIFFRGLEGVSISQTSMYESNRYEGNEPKHKILSWEESIPVSGHRAYLVPLWSTSEWSSSEMKDLAATIQSELGCPVHLLKAVQVKGEFPRNVDGYVVATALLACESAGVDLNTERDAISFRGGEYSPGVDLGVIIIEVMKELQMDDIEILNAVNQILWNRSVEPSLNRLKMVGDAAVSEIASGILEGAAGGLGSDRWWDGAKELCKLLSQIGTPAAQNALLTILTTDSSIVEFDQVRATAAQQLSAFRNNAVELIPKLVEASKLPHAPLPQIQSAIKALGGQMPVTPELIIKPSQNMLPVESIKYLSAFQNQVADWNKDQQRNFFWTLGHKIKAAFTSYGPRDANLALHLARPYFAAALLADPSPEADSWNEFEKLEKSEANAKRLANEYPLPEKVPSPEESTRD